MSILPRPPVPKDEHGDPPAVAYWRDRLKESRVGAWAKGHKTLAAVLAGLLALLKSWRWLVYDLWHVLAHPERSASWVGDNLVLVGAISAGIFLFVFLSARFGLDHLLGDEDETEVDHARRQQRIEQARDEAALARR